MEIKKIESLESYFKTPNPHWNSHAFKLLCEVLKLGNFENPEVPLRLFSAGIDIFTENSKTPLLGLQLFTAEVEALQLSKAQAVFVYEAVCRYLTLSEFDEIDVTEVKELLKGQKERLLHETQALELNKPLTGNIRESLKELMQKEIESLADTLKELEPIQRLNILCKLIPFVLPKVESITHSLGEPDITVNNCIIV